MGEKKRDPYLDYWIECIECAFDSASITATAEQIADVAETVKGGHECYGMAFYSPPASDGYARIDREWKEKYAALEREFEQYRNGAETAVRRALKQFPDTVVSITTDGDVYRHGGRTEQIG